MKRKIQKHIIFISGFMQNHATYGGIAKMHHEFHCSHTSPICMVSYYPQGSNWSNVAEGISRVSEDDAEVYVFAYSWGVGNGLCRLSRELGDRGISIKHAVCCDGVAQVGPPGVRALVAYCPCLYVNLPATVKKVTVLRQRNEDKKVRVKYGKLKLYGLRGHNILISGTKVPDYWIEGRTHTNMDEAPEFKQACRKALECKPLETSGE